MKKSKLSCWSKLTTTAIIAFLTIVCAGVFVMHDFVANDFPVPEFLDEPAIADVSSSVSDLSDEELAQGHQDIVRYRSRLRIYVRVLSWFEDKTASISSKLRGIIPKAGLETVGQTNQIDGVILEQQTTSSERKQVFSDENSILQQ